MSKQEAINVYLLPFLILRLHWFLRYLQAVRWEDLLEQVDTFAVLQVRDDL